MKENAKYQHILDAELKGLTMKNNDEPIHNQIIFQTQKNTLIVDFTPNANHWQSFFFIQILNYISYFLSIPMQDDSEHFKTHCICILYQPHHHQFLKYLHQTPLC